MNTIELNNVTKKYGDFTALNNISFEIPKNAIVGLVGSNGSGKTTLLKCLLGYFDDFTGDINLLGKNVTEITQKDNLLSYIPDEPVYYEELTVREHLEFISKMYVSEVKLSGLIEEFELERHLDKFPHELSKGNKKKLLICCAILREFAMLIADEPFSGLDPIQIDVFREKIKELQREGKTILISTHLLALIENLCDYYIIIDKSNLIEHGRLEDILKKVSKNKSLEELYLDLSKTINEYEDIIYE